MRCWPRRTTVTTPARCSAPRCFETGDWAIFIRTTISLTACSWPSERTAMTWRRRGSAMAVKTSAGWALRVMEKLYIPDKEYVKRQNGGMCGVF